MKLAKIVFIQSLNLMFCTDDGQDNLALFLRAVSYNRVICSELYAQQNGSELAILYRTGDTPSVRLNHQGEGTTIIWGDS